MLNTDATLDGGSICVAEPARDPDLPDLHINQDFTIGAGADAVAFQCRPRSTPCIHLNGPDGHLIKAGPGTTTSTTPCRRRHRDRRRGQTFVFSNAYAQSAG